MPELLEVEAYRELLERRGLDREIVAVEAPDAWYLKGGLDAPSLRTALLGQRFTSARRHGKVLLAGLTGLGTLGLRFGMTGRLLVDGRAGVDDLLYSSNEAHEAWDRLVVGFADGGDLRVRDPRRLGGIVLDPDLGGLGPDAAAIGLRNLRAALAASRAPVKAFLMDQSRVAGLGNLLTDELLFRAGIDPARVAHSLDDDEVRGLHRSIRATVRLLGRRGGSHTGDLQAHRRPGGACPRDGAALARRTIGGRTTWSCPEHQR